MRRALITGIAGQDGSYLAELLLKHGYEVYGIVRRVSIEYPERRFWRIRHILDKIVLVPGSLDSYVSVSVAMNRIRPDECYHLAAESFVSYSFDDTSSGVGTNINQVRNILCAIKEVVPECRFYFAGTSEMFGNARVTPQHEETPFYPRSPYGISKLAGYHFTRNYREVYNLYALSGILFNHESPRRGFEFVTRKVTSSVAKIKLGLAEKVAIGNLEAKRDWGYAKDYVKAMWLMLQQDAPNDYVIATGETHSVNQLLEVAFGHVGLNWKSFVVIDRDLYRPSEVHELRGDSRKARQELNWEPTISFEELIMMMVDEDMKRLSEQKAL